MKKEDFSRERKGYLERQEMEHWMESRLTVVGELRGEVNRLHHGFYDWSIEQKKGLSGLVDRREYDGLIEDLEKKADRQEIKGWLEGIVDKQTVKGWLEKKADKQEVKGWLEGRVDKG